MPPAPALLPRGEYLYNLAEQHASGRGYHFDETGKAEFRQVSDDGMHTANEAGIFTVEDIMRDVAPNTIRLTDAAIMFAEGVMLTAKSVKKGLSRICPLFPFC